jgi:mutator protein MutT
MRKRVSVIIIKDEKLLLVKGSKGFYADFYFTPGGKVERGETDYDAIVRECKEELSIIPTDSKMYLSYETELQGTEKKQLVNCYIVQAEVDKIQLSSEVTSGHWYSLADYNKKSPNIADSIYDNLIPALIRDKLIA